MRPNIGLVNAFMRITCGFTMLAWSTAKLTRRPSKTSYLVVAMLGGMKIAEGITRFCPLTALYEEYRETEIEEDLAPPTDMIPINPT